MTELTEDQIKAIMKNPEMVRALKQITKKDKPIVKSIKKIERIIAHNTNLIGIDLNKANIRVTSSLIEYCNQKGYKIKCNYLELNPLPEKPRNLVEELTTEREDLTEKLNTHYNILHSIATRIKEIDLELVDLKKKEEEQRKTEEE